MVCAAASTALLQARARSVIAAHLLVARQTRRDEQLRCFGPAQRTRGRRAGCGASLRGARAPDQRPRFIACGKQGGGASACAGPACGNRGWRTGVGDKR